jgi:hypothetical protein
MNLVIRYKIRLSISALFKSGILPGGPGFPDFVFKPTIIVSLLALWLIAWLLQQASKSDSSSSSDSAAALGFRLAMAAPGVATGFHGSVDAVCW